MIVKSRILPHINIYRVVTALGLILAIILVMVIPAQMSGASPWAYYYAVKNFSQGQLTVSDHIHNQQVRDARQQGGILAQYVRIGANKWAVEKAPGYIFYLVPFELMGIPRWGNVLLAAGMVIVTFLLLKRLRNEETACIGSLLMLFTPIGLIMFNRAYMDTFASLAFLAMGGGLYFYYHLARDKYSRLKSSFMLFIAFLLIGWSVVTRQSNLLVAVVLALHFIITRGVDFFKGERGKLATEIAGVVLGAGLPMTALLIYNNHVFGSPLDYGYNYTPFPVEFAYNYLGQVTPDGQSLPWKIIIDNLRNVPLPLIEGFPLLIVGVPGIGAVLYFKLFRKRHKPDGKWASLHNELPWGTLLVLAGWFLSVYVLYIMYEFTAEYLKSSSSFFRYSRYYLPGLFPVAVVSALIVTRLPRKFGIPVMAAIITAGIVLYFQVALDPRA